MTCEIGQLTLAGGPVPIFKSPIFGFRPWLTSSWRCAWPPEAQGQAWPTAPSGESAPDLSSVQEWLWCDFCPGSQEWFRSVVFCGIQKEEVKPSTQHSGPPPSISATAAPHFLVYILGFGMRLHVELLGEKCLKSSVWMDRSKTLKTRLKTNSICGFSPTLTTSETLCREVKPDLEAEVEKCCMLSLSTYQFSPQVGREE